MVHNTGRKPTFIRGDQSSFIDVTLSSRKVGRKIQNWTVLEMENLSNYQYSCFDINEKVTVKRTRQYKTIDWDAFRAVIKIRATAEKMDPEEATKLVERSYKDCVRSNTPYGGTARLTRNARKQRGSEGPSRGKLRAIRMKKGYKLERGLELVRRS